MYLNLSDSSNLGKGALDVSDQRARLVDQLLWPNHALLESLEILLDRQNALETPTDNSIQSIANCRKTEGKDPATRVEKLALHRLWSGDSEHHQHDDGADLVFPDPLAALLKNLRYSYHLTTSSLLLPLQQVQNLVVHIAGYRSSTLSQSIVMSQTRSLLTQLRGQHFLRERLALDAGDNRTS